MPRKKKQQQEKLKIYACAIDYQYIYTFCPNPKCRQQIHIYRSNGSLKDREFEYINHCYMVDSPEYITLCVVPATKRSSVTHYRNGTFIFSDRKFRNSHPNVIKKNNLIKKHIQNSKKKTTIKKNLVVTFD